MSAWFNYEATGKILVFSLLVGAALPALFALGVRLRAAGCGDTGVGGAVRSPTAVLLIALSWAIFALVLLVVVLGVLYIARDFIAHHTGYPFLGAKPA